MGIIPSRLSKIDDSYNNNFKFKTKKFKCKILEIIDMNKYKIAFYFKKKIYTWIFILKNCSARNICDTDPEIDIYHIRNLLLEYKFLCYVKCIDYQDGIIIGEIYLNHLKLSEILYEKGYYEYTQSNSLDECTTIIDNVIPLTPDYTINDNTYENLFTKELKNKIKEKVNLSND